MKSPKYFSKWLTCVLTASALIGISAANAADGRAVIRAVRGTVEYFTTRDGWKPLRVGTVLGPSALIRTGVNSGTDLFLGENGPTVRLLAETTLGLDKLSLERTGVDVVIETFLDLQKGTIQGNVKPLAAASKYEVKTPLTRCEIRGTEYQISADGKHHVIRGSLIIFYIFGPPGARYPVNAGQTFVPPADHTVPGARPTVRPTLPDEQLLWAIIIDDDELWSLPPLPPPPEPLEFISPGSGRPAQ
ncbi:MAG: FecR domain-containing protein [Verrucomicrobia bacterium]|nr:FecR domain-containing protein [Verrucomicrobiota bacterium]